MNYKILEKAVASKVYLLSLFEYPISGSRLNTIIYGKQDGGRRVREALYDLKNYEIQVTETLGTKYLKKRLKHNRLQEKIHRMSLEPIFDYWKKEFENNKKRYIMKIKEAKSYMPPMNDVINVKIEPVITECSRELTAEMINSIKPITASEIKILNSFFFNEKNFAIIKKNFENYTQYHIREPNVEFNALELMTSFFIILLSRVRTIYIRNFLKNAKNVPIEKRKQILSMFSHHELDGVALKLLEEIDINRIDELAAFLSILTNEPVNMRNLARNLYGFNPNLE